MILAQETLGFRRTSFSLVLSLLMSAFALGGPPAVLTIDLHRRLQCSSTALFREPAASRRAPWPPSGLVWALRTYVGGAGGQLGRASRLSSRRLMLVARVAATTPFAGPPDLRSGLIAGLRVADARRMLRWSTMQLLASKSRASSCRGQDQQQDPPRRTDCRLGPACRSSAHRAQQDGRITVFPP
jgi:hypothetical protein